MLSNRVQFEDYSSWNLKNETPPILDGRNRRAHFKGDLPLSLSIDLEIIQSVVLHN